MSLGTRIALLVGAAVLLATAITGTGLALSSRSVGRNVIDRELDAAAMAFSNADGRPDPLIVRAAFQLQVARCERPAEDTGTAAQLAADDAGPPPAPGNDGNVGGNGGGDGPGDRDRNPRRQDGPLVPRLRSGLQLVEANGDTVATCLPPFAPIEKELSIAEVGVGKFRRSLSIDGDRYRVLTIGYPGLGAVQFAEELEVAEGATAGLMTRIVAYGLIGAALAGAFGWFWARRATRPVQQLSATAERVALTQDLGERIPISGNDTDYRNDEIGNLAASFNRMLVSLDTSREQQHRLVQDASHELRTPLTSIRTNIDLLQRHPNLDQDTRTTVLNDIRAELEELSDLTAELVESATEFDDSPSSRIEVELQSLVEACLHRARRSHSREIELAVTNPALVEVDPAAVRRAIDNVIGNAAKFTPAEGAITVAVDGGTVTVDDRGPGIPEADLPNVFDRFYRSTTARTQPGSGLGLSIVQQVVHAHGGDVFAKNRVGGGASVGFTLPTVN